eukprot:GHVR01141390.1.p1 GENE.GHVR01141390.1~~GHVR01141390.1.p1  ORF type:complete len:189 (+),score=4.91 GHVR01141390.1:713-1279(+)
MRYPASEKLEIVRMVERSSRPAKWTLDKVGVQCRTFYRWYDRYLEHGEDGLVDRAPHPGRVWNKIPDNIRAELLDMALDIPELSPRELAVRFTDTKGYFVSESSVYRLLKAHDLISSPAFIVMEAASEFRDKTTAIKQMWRPKAMSSLRSRHKQTSPTSKSLVGVGCICRTSLMTSHVTSSAGGSARQ